ncbi:hypothetical protein C8R46DRAFT_1216858 [Mycena filopes]|nr:hypothetical protein C8R46DRAFT_1216858 [Mycena filopes]
MALERSSSPPHKAAVVAVISRRTIVKIDSARVWWSLGLELFNLELSQVCVCRGNYVVGLKLFMLESSRPRSASGNLCSTELDSSLFKYWLTGLLTGSLQSSATVYPHSTQPRTIYRSFAPTAAAATALSPSSPSSHPAAAFVHTGTRTNPCALHWYRRTQGSGTTPQSTSSPAPPQSHPVRSLPQSIAFDPPLQPTVAHSIDASKCKRSSRVQTLPLLPPLHHHLHFAIQVIPYWRPHLALSRQLYDLHSAADPDNTRLSLSCGTMR